MEKIYKDGNNKIHVIDDKFTHLLPSGCVEITQAKADSIRSAASIKSTYSQLRAAEYPPITDYLDGVVKGDAVQVRAYVDACLAVKAKYPKP